MSKERPHPWISYSDGRYFLHESGSDKPLHADPAVLESIRIAAAIDRMAQATLKAIDNDNSRQCAACGNTCTHCSD